MSEFDEIHPQEQEGAEEAAGRQRGIAVSTWGMWRQTAERMISKISSTSSGRYDRYRSTTVFHNQQDWPLSGDDKTGLRVRYIRRRT